MSCLTEWIFLRRSGIFDRILDLHVQGRECPICFVPLRRPEGNQDIVHRELPRLRRPARGDGPVHRPRGPRPPAAFADSSGSPCQSRSLRAAGELCGLSLHVERARSQLADRQVAATRRRTGIAPIRSPSSKWDCRRSIASEPGSPCRNMCGNVSLLEMAEVIRRASLVRRRRQRPRPHRQRRPNVWRRSDGPVSKIRATRSFQRRLQVRCECNDPVRAHGPGEPLHGAGAVGDRSRSCPAPRCARRKRRGGGGRGTHSGA